MNIDDIKVELNPLGGAKIKAGSQYEIQEKIVEAYMKKQSMKNWLIPLRLTVGFWKSRC